MKMSNAKNLRREVKRQLKELRGRVGEQASLATKTMTETIDEKKSLTLTPSGVDLRFNSHLSSLNSMNNAWKTIIKVLIAALAALASALGINAMV